MNVLSLFSGIGGLELGLERAGMNVVGQVELDTYCQRVLAKHWPEVPRHDDVRTTVEWWQSQPRPPVGLVCGGFPCQPFSNLGLGLGTTDERWGWPWMRDVIDAVRPRYVLIENVDELRRDTRAFHCVLSDLSTLGFDAEWSVVSACSVGAPHTRRRVFVLAYSTGDHGEQPVHLPPTVAARRAAPGAAGCDPLLEQRVAIRGDTGGYLNPAWVAWLMGFPNAWLPPLSMPSETQSSPKLRNTPAVS